SARRRCGLAGPGSRSSRGRGRRGPWRLVSGCRATPAYLTRRIRVDTPRPRVLHLLPESPRGTATMNRFLHGVARAAFETFDLPGPVLEVGSFQVAGQEDLIDLRRYF